MSESLGKYQLERRLAVGGMAEIFLATHVGPEGFKRSVAIKRILPHLSEDSGFVTMFLDEARLVARFSHPNLVQIYDLGESDESYYLAMEYVHGASMDQVLWACGEKGIALPLEFAAKIVSHACDGLDYAHDYTDADGTQLNLIHRDVSPQNIMLSYDGLVKLLDFGIAKATSNIYKTRAGVIKGKASFMSPEQVTGRKDLDRRSDIFSLGVVLYEFTTGARPYSGENEADILRAIVNADADDPLEHNPDLPDEIVRIIDRALQKNREKRYASAREMKVDLENFLFGRRAMVDSHALAEFLESVLSPEEMAAGYLRSSPSGMSRSIEGDQPPTLLTPRPITSNTATHTPTGSRPRVSPDVQAPGSAAGSRPRSDPTRKPSSRPRTDPTRKPSSRPRTDPTRKPSSRPRTDPTRARPDSSPAATPPGSDAGRSEPARVVIGSRPRPDPRPGSTAEARARAKRKLIDRTVVSDGAGKPDADVTVRPVTARGMELLGGRPRRTLAAAVGGVVLLALIVAGMIMVSDGPAAVGPEAVAAEPGPAVDDARRSPPPAPAAAERPTGEDRASDTARPEPGAGPAEAAIDPDLALDRALQAEIAQLSDDEPEDEMAEEPRAPGIYLPASVARHRHTPNTSGSDEAEPPEPGAGPPAPRKDAPGKGAPGKDAPKNDTLKKDTPNKVTPNKETARKSEPRKVAVHEKEANAARLAVISKPLTSVIVDGVDRGSAPVDSIELKPGAHVVELRSKRHGISYRETIRIAAGKSKTLRKTFGQGKLQVFVKPFGEVFVDGRRRGLTPLEHLIELYEGTHDLRVSCDRTHKTRQVKVVIKTGKTAIEKIDLR